MLTTAPHNLRRFTIDPLANAPDLPRQYTYAEVAALKKVTRQTVYEWVKRGAIPSPVYTGATARFTETMVDVILNHELVPGTYTVARSPRAALAAAAAAARRPAAGPPPPSPPSPPPTTTITVPRPKRATRCTTKGKSRND